MRPSSGTSPVHDTNTPALQLVPPRSIERRASPLALWHLLSLDAPTVAALWTWFLARCIDLRLPWTAPTAMFIAVWMIYAADRLLDARLLDARTLDTPMPSHDLEERHRFHHRHRGGFLAVLAVAACALVCLLPRIGARALLLYSLLATLLATWLLIIHARGQQVTSTRRLPKELAVGIFFPAAIFIPSVARAPGLQLHLLPAALLFAGLCTLNCLFLYAWEHPPATSEFKKHSAHWTTLWAIRHLPQLTSTLIAITLIAAALSPLNRLPALACALSTMLLLLLHARRHHLLPVHLRAAADAVLLTPLLLLPFLHLIKP